MSDIDLHHQATPRVWIVAGLCALVLHLGGGALALSAMQPKNEIALGAPAIEIGLELLSPRLLANDLPVGPDTAASPASPRAVEQTPLVEQRDSPRAPPTETDDPERTVTLNQTKTPPPDKHEIMAVQSAPRADSAAAEETTTPSVATAAEALHSVAPDLGAGESQTSERRTWQKELAAHFNKYKHYPSDRTTQHAEVILSVVLDRVGHVLSTHILKGSGDPAFDAEALAMLQRADPVPPPPPLVADEGLTFTLPLYFRAGQR